MYYHYTVHFSAEMIFYMHNFPDIFLLNVYLAWKKVARLDYVENKQT